MMAHTARWHIIKDRTPGTARPWCLYDRVTGGEPYRRSTYALIVHTMLRKAEDGL